MLAWLDFQPYDLSPSNSQKQNSQFYSTEAIRRFVKVWKGVECGFDLEMARLLLLVFLFIVLIVTSQVEWKQPLALEQAAALSGAAKLLRVTERQESVKEKIILSQEKNIHDLRNAVRDLQEQLRQCQGLPETSNHTSTTHSVDSNVFEMKRVDIPQD